MMPDLELMHHVFGEERGFLSTFSGRRATDGSLGALRPACFPYLHGLEAARRWLSDENRRGREAYFCAHLLTAKRRIKANAASLSALYVDGDGATPGTGIPAPTAVVESSPGREHFYWRLIRPVAPRVGEALNRRLAHAMGGDGSGWDLTQLLRPPGTRNHKYPDAPPVMLRELRDAAYDSDEIDRLLPPLPHKRPREARHIIRPKIVGPAPNLSRLSVRMRDLIQHGNRGQYPCRSRADMAACVAMFGAGYSAGEVWATMTDPVNGISEKFTEKGRDGDRYLALTICKAQGVAEVSPPRRPSRSRARRIRKGVDRG